MTATPAAPYVDLLLERLAAKGAEIVLRYQRCDISAAELRASIHRYARALAGLGVGRRDLVALFATNSPDAIAIRYAAHLVGAAAVAEIDLRHVSSIAKPASAGWQLRWLPSGRWPLGSLR
jgi:acyl-CoA synthetase (AMP-forming)/AMP-acid ligase II